MPNSWIVGDIVDFEGGDTDGEFSGTGTIERVDHRHLLVAATHEYHGDSMYHGAVVLVRKCDARRLTESEREGWKQRLETQSAPVRVVQATPPPAGWVNPTVVGLRRILQQCRACNRPLTIRGDGTKVCPSALCVNAGIVQAR